MSLCSSRTAHDQRALICVCCDRCKCAFPGQESTVPLESYAQHDRRQRYPVGLSRLFCARGARNRAVVAARAAQRPDIDVHQCRHGAVQERLHRPGKAALCARDHGAEMRPRRRQAQRPRQCRLYRAAPHLLRDARQFLVRRLLQGTRDRAGLEADDQGIRRAGRKLMVTVYIDDDEAFNLWKKIAGLPERKILRIAGSRQFLGDGRYRPVRPLLGDFLRSRRAHSGRPAGQPGRRRRSLCRNLESRLHAVRAACRRQAHRPAAAVDRYRHGARAHGRGAARHPRQLQDRSVRRADRGGRRTDRRRS